MSSWIDYWNGNEAMTGDLWKAQSDFFVRQVSNVIAFGPDDVVLDIGCGNGHVIASLAERVREAHGADTSQSSVERARGHFSGQANLHFHALAPDKYLAVDSLPLPPVTRILCVSVLQYYRSTDEIRTLLMNAKKIAAPGCQMLLADLLVDYNIYKDIAGVLLGGFLSGTFIAKLKEVLSGKHKFYAKVRAQNPVLTLTRKDIADICMAEKLPLRFLPGNLTGNCFRANALIALNPLR